MHNSLIERDSDETIINVVTRRKCKNYDDVARNHGYPSANLVRDGLDYDNIFYIAQSSSNLSAKNRKSILNFKVAVVFDWCIRSKHNTIRTSAARVLKTFIDGTLSRDALLASISRVIHTTTPATKATKWKVACILYQNCREESDVSDFLVDDERESVFTSAFENMLNHFDEMIDVQQKIASLSKYALGGAADESLGRDVAVADAIVFGLKDLLKNGAVEAVDVEWAGKIWTSFLEDADTENIMSDLGDREIDRSDLAPEIADSPTHSHFEGPEVTNNDKDIASSKTPPHSRRPSSSPSDVPAAASCALVSNPLIGTSSTFGALSIDGGLLSQDPLSFVGDEASIARDNMEFQMAYLHLFHLFKRSSNILRTWGENVRDDILRTALEMARVILDNSIPTSVVIDLRRTVAGFSEIDIRNIASLCSTLCLVSLTDTFNEPIPRVKNVMMFLSKASFDDTALRSLHKFKEFKF
jgi:hypothetical protein